MWNDDYLYGTTLRTRTFKKIFPQLAFDDETVTDDTNFRWLYENCGFPQKVTSKPTTGIDYLKVIYILLLSRYGESHIASQNENRFKLEVMRLIFQYGPLWEKELKIQDELRDLSLSDITNGSLVKHAHAYNPSVEISIDSTAVPVNELNTTKYEKSKLDGYNELLLLLNKDVTDEFLNRFKNLFVKIGWEVPISFSTLDLPEDDEDEE